MIYLDGSWALSLDIISSESWRFGSSQSARRDDATKHTRDTWARGQPTLLGIPLLMLVASYTS